MNDRLKLKGVEKAFVNGVHLEALQYLAHWWVAMGPGWGAFGIFAKWYV